MVVIDEVALDHVAVLDVLLLDQTLDVQRAAPLWLDESQQKDRSDEWIFWAMRSPGRSNYLSLSEMFGLGMDQSQKVRGILLFPTPSAHVPTVESVLKVRKV